MKRLLMILCAIISLPAFAELWSSNATITRLYPYADGLIFNSTYANNSLSSCEGGTRFQIAKSHSNYDTLVSAMMLAFASGKEITFVVEAGQAQTCAPTINRFIVLN